MKDTIDLSKIASGSIKVYKIVNGKRFLILARKNTILANAKYLLARMLMRDSTGNIYSIRMFNGGALQAVGVISGMIYLNPNEIQFSTLFDEASFSGAVTQMFLSPQDPVLMGDFSQVTGLALNKLITEQLQITWNIKFN
jgi:hypothetical protein